MLLISPLLNGVCAMNRHSVRQLALLSIVFAGLAALNGCGSGGKCTLTGKVTSNGKPVYGGVITVFGDNDQVARGSIEFDGTYLVNDAPTGTVRIGVVSQKPAPPRAERGEGRSAATGTQQVGDPNKWFAINEKYADPNSSGIELKLKGGSNSHEIKVD
jgi:hypothetical protein